MLKAKKGAAGSSRVPLAKSSGKATRATEGWGQSR
jgi:hypothetical protein